MPNAWSPVAIPAVSGLIDQSSSLPPPMNVSPFGISTLEAFGSPALAYTLPPTFWINGGYWFDLSQSLVSSIGSRALVPVSSPPTVSPAMGGNAALSLDGVAQYLQLNSISNLAGVSKPLTVAASFRSVDTGTNVVWGFGNTGGSIEMSGAWVSEFPSLITQTGLGGGSISRTGANRLRYDSHVIVWVYDGAGNTSIYVDGVADTVSNSSSPMPSGAFNTFAVGTWLASAPQSPLGGFLQRFAISDQAASPTQATLLSALWGPINDTILPIASSPRFMWIGDSITQGDTGNNAGGYRVNLENHIISQHWSLNSVGQYNQGQFPNNRHASLGGSDLATIRNTALANLSAYGSVKLIIFMGGTNNMVTMTTANALAAYATCLHDVYVAAAALDPTVKIAVTTILPQQVGNPGQTNVDPFNAGLPALWAAHQATFPGSLITWDCNAVFADTWSSTYWDANAVHPNSAGYNKMFTDGLLPAISSYLASISPT